MTTCALISLLIFFLDIYELCYKKSNFFFGGTKYEQLNKIEFMQHGLLLKSRCKPDISNKSLRFTNSSLMNV